MTAARTPIESFDKKLQAKVGGRFTVRVYESDLAKLCNAHDSLLAQRDALAEALRDLLADVVSDAQGSSCVCCDMHAFDGHAADCAAVKARAALAAVDGAK
jgi:hypothetical protein